MEIKRGYNKKKVEIRVSNPDSRGAELWIEFENKKIPQETLSYISLDELLDLKDEIQNSINKIVGIGK